jgi:hypothetical protein
MSNLAEANTRRIGVPYRAIDIKSIEAFKDDMSSKAHYETFHEQEQIQISFAEHRRLNPVTARTQALSFIHVPE